MAQERRGRAGHLFCTNLRGYDKQKGQLEDVAQEIGQAFSSAASH
jgi:hypothetical protein